jgi:hypothetical protein
MRRAARGLLWAVLVIFGLAALLGVRLDWSPPEPDSAPTAAHPPLPPPPAVAPCEPLAHRNPCPVLPIPPAQ